MQPHVTPIVWNGLELKLLDQRRLPLESEYILCRSAAEVADAIRSMVVRGAPAIGVCAAFGVAIAAQSSPATTPDELRGEIAAATSILRATRPTAINLGWALDRMVRRFEVLARDSESAGTIKEALRDEAESMFREDVEANHRIGQVGSELLAGRATVLTHCNAGALATAGYGTALGVIRSAVESGKSIRVFAGETRPYLQGARLTAWELQQDGIDVTLITDSMAGHFFQQKMFDAVIVGADRIAANGDTANKIGTYTLAVLAKAHEIPFYVAAPISTIDLQCSDGSQIPIEERSIDEVTETQGLDSTGAFHRIRLAPRGIQARHPAFDVTPARLITAIITDRGLARAPYDESLNALVRAP